MTPFNLQHEDDEIETLLSEESSAIDPSLWEKSTTATTPIDVHRRTTKSSTKRNKVNVSSSGSCCMFSVWLAASMLLGILITLAVDHRDEILQKLPSSWKIWINETFLVLDNSTTSTTTTSWNPFNDTKDQQQNVSMLPLEDVTQNTNTALTANNNNNNSSDLDQNVSAPTVPNVPVSAAEDVPSSSKEDLPVSSVEEEDDAPHVWLENLKYRRVCTDVYESKLCLTIRHPFDVPLQDPTLSYPDPVDDRFYKLRDLIMMDGPLLEQCRNPQPQNATNDNNTANQTINDRVFACLEQVASQYPNGDTAVAVFTRRKANKAGQEDFFGTQLPVQRRRNVEFFRGHVMLILGASPAPAVSHCLKDLFDICTSANKGGGFNCNTATESKAIAATATESTQDNHHHDRLLRRRGRRQRQLQQLQDPPLFLEQAWLRVVGYYSTDRRVEPTHIANATRPLVDVLKTEASFLAGLSVNPTATTTQQQPPSQQLRPLTVLVEFPIAHAQTETMITNYIDQVYYNQMELTNKIMNLTTSPQAQNELASLGLKLARVIAFDGLPQHFPTKTGGYIKEVDIRDGTAGDQVIGTSCRGPLPPNSPLKRVNAWERLAFEHYGLDMGKFYARTWEFANQFWWQEKMWEGKGGQLDCTHTHATKGGAGMTMVHKFFVQAMVDGYYESQARR